LDSAIQPVEHPARAVKRIFIFFFTRFIFFTMTSLSSNQSTTTAPTHVLRGHSAGGAIGSVIGLCFVMLLSITGNVAIIVIFRVFKRVRKQVTNHFLINLAVSDLIVALVTMPFWMLFEIDRWDSILRWIDVFTLEHVWTFVDIGMF
jgi:hypothetical protein